MITPIVTTDNNTFTFLLLQKIQIQCIHYTCMKCTFIIHSRNQGLSSPKSASDLCHMSYNKALLSDHIKQHTCTYNYVAIFVQNVLVTIIHVLSIFPLRELSVTVRRSKEKVKREKKMKFILEDGTLLEETPYKPPSQSGPQQSNKPGMFPVIKCMCT